MLKLVTLATLFMLGNAPQQAPETRPLVALTGPANLTRLPEGPPGRIAPPVLVASAFTIPKQMVLTAISDQAAQVALNGIRSELSKTFGGAPESFMDRMSYYAREHQSKFHGLESGFRCFLYLAASRSASVVYINMFHMLGRPMYAPILNNWTDVVLRLDKQAKLFCDDQDGPGNHTGLDYFNELPKGQQSAYGEPVITQDAERQADAFVAGAKEAYYNTRSVLQKVDAKMMAINAAILAFLAYLAEHPELIRQAVGR